MTNPGSERLRILVVDDEPEIRELLCAYLQARGHTVLTAPDGQGALDRIKDSRIDVLLTDVQMPQVTGVELVSALHSAEIHIGIVVMTGFPTIESATTALKMGASDYMLKPFRLREIYTAIMRASERGRTERTLARLQKRTAFYEHILTAPTEQLPGSLRERLPGLLRAEVGAEACALWQGDGTAIFIGEGLEALSPGELTGPMVEGLLAAVPLSTGGALAARCAFPADPAHLDRLGTLARMIAAALER